MNKRGQSMIEYALIAVLVILGVVIMGPYVLRSVNAHFKLWDEGVQDSLTENLTQAPVSEIPNITLNCACQTAKGDCGSSQGGSPCGANQRIYNHTCNPQLCDGAPASSCVDDPTCCTGWVSIGCGNFPCPVGGCPATATPPPASNNCYYGQEIQAQQCGANNNIQCVENSPPCLMPACLGIVSPGAQPCANEPPQQGALLQNNGITYVQGSVNCNPNATCQYYCAPPFILNSTGTGCSQTYIVAPVVPNSTNGGYNDWQICAAPGVTLTVTSQTPQNGCGNGISDNPPGTPGTQCTVSFTY